jgi:hypothetical protein
MLGKDCTDQLDGADHAIGGTPGFHLASKAAIASPQISGATLV